MPTLGRFIVLLSLLAHLVAGATSAQAPAPKTQPDYSKEAFIYEQHSTKVTFENKGSSTREVAARVRIQSEAGVQQFGVIKFTYESAVESIQINYVRVRKPDGTVIETPVDNIQDMPADITRAAPFYSDIREKHVAVKALSPGDVLEYAYNSQADKPLIPGQFWLDYTFIHSNIALQETLEVRVPRNRALKVKSLVTQASIADDKDTRIYSWSGSNTESKQEADEPRKNALEQTEGRFPQPDVRMSSFQSWEEIGRWYDSLQRDRMVTSPEIKAKATELTTNAPDDNAKLHAIYNYVSLQFRYIGVAFGIGRYQPHSATEILTNQYGDCKDKHTLLAALLTAAGFHVYPVLINTVRDIDVDVPSPSQFNHVISVVERGEGLTWLDTTTEVGPFGYLIPQLLNKRGLVIAESKPAQLLSTPAVLPFKSLFEFKCEGKLSTDGTLEAKIERMDRGDGEVLLRDAFRQLPQTQWKDLVQKVSYASGFGGEVSNVVVGSLDSLDEPFRVSYDYKRKNYGDWDHRRIGAPLPLLLYQEANDEKKESVPFWLGSPSEASLESRVELPKGYSMNPLGNFDAKYDFADFHASYEVTNGAFIAKRRISTYKTEVPVTELDDFKLFRKAVIDDYEEMASVSSELERATSESAARQPVQQAILDLPDSANPEALSLESNGRGKMQSHDIPGATEDFSHAVQVDPKFARVWIELGMAYLLHARKDEAIEALRSAIKADPKQAISYKTLAYVFVQTQQNDKAVEVLRDLTKTIPGDSDGHSKLASMLFTLKQYSEAASEYQAAIQQGKDAANLEAALGLSYFKAGDHDRGSVALDKAISLDSSPVMLNNVGYELADANLELSRALDYAEKAVRAVEDESRLVTLESLTKKDLDRMSSLAADWDTLGWVYFRLRRFDEAEKFLAAAWNLSQSPVVGDHLGQVYEAQRSIPAAIRAYKLALAASTSWTNPNDMPETRKRLARLNSAAAVGSSPQAAEELGRMRSTHLRRIVAGSASADFFLLISNGPYVEDIKFVSGDGKLKSAADVLKATKLKVLFPDHGPTLLVRRGMVVCSGVTGCEFVLLTASSVHSVN